jgi:hypothetical protein
MPSCEKRRGEIDKVNWKVVDSILGALFQRTLDEFYYKQLFQAKSSFFVKSLTPCPGMRLDLSLYLYICLVVAKSFSVNVTFKSPAHMTGF